MLLAKAGPLSADVVDVVSSITEYLKGLPLKGIFAGLVATYAGKLLWYQYSILLKRRLPPYSLEIPFLGANIEQVKYGYHGWAQHHALAKGQHARISYLGGRHTVLVSWTLWLKYLKRADNEGELTQGKHPKWFQDYLGPEAIEVLRGGKGQNHHRRIRSKLLEALAPKKMVLWLPNIISYCRENFDQMCESTRTKGYGTVWDRATDVALRTTILPITGKLELTLETELNRAFHEFVTGGFSTPLDLGSWTAYGRGLKAIKRAHVMVAQIMQMPPEESGPNFVQVLAAEGFTVQEITETLLSYSIGSLLTNVNILSETLVELARRPEWRARLAAEPLEVRSPEDDSDAMRFVRECLRLHPPEALCFRSNPDGPIDIGEWGVIPRGCNICPVLAEHLMNLGEEFDPDRWADPQAVRDDFIVFGHRTTHTCPSLHLALLELMTFARIMAREYDVEIVDSTLVRDYNLGSMWLNSGPFLTFKDGLKVKVSKRA